MPSSGSGKRALQKARDVRAGGTESAVTSLKKGKHRLKPVPQKKKPRQGRGAVFYRYLCTRKQSFVKKIFHFFERFF
jgi:hypothetical protein